MNTSASNLNRIESQRSTDDHFRRRSFPMNLISNCLASFSSRGSLQLQARRAVAEFFENLRLSDLFDLPGEYVPMNSEMFYAASAGNKEGLEKLRRNGTIPMACFKSEGGDSVLHLAASSGHLEAVKSIICECPCLLLETNLENQLPIHVAAGAGYVGVVEAFAETLTFLSSKLPEEERETLNLYVVKDIDGDTAMHLALKERRMKTAECLLNANQEASFLANKSGISPLYLGIEAGNVSLVKSMLRNNLLNQKLEGRKDLVHAALKARNTDILDVILTEDPSLGGERDKEGRTCLSFAASIGFYNGVSNLLDRSTQSVYICNDDGSFPIHLAVEKGHNKVVKEILKRCPDSKQFLNKHCQNILHIASCQGSFSVLHNLARSSETRHLCSERDVNGNTPFQLATKNWRPRSANIVFGF